MKRSVRALLAAASCFTLAFWPNTAAIAAVTVPLLPQPTTSFDLGMLHVDRYGDGTTPIIFIPGVGCGPWSSAEQIRRFSRSYTVYTITLSMPSHGFCQRRHDA